MYIVEDIKDTIFKTYDSALQAAIDKHISSFYINTYLAGSITINSENLKKALAALRFLRDDKAVILKAQEFIKEAEVKPYTAEII